MKPMEGSLADRVDALLPQAQCTQCGFAACRPYAEAVAAGASHDRCAPGGEATVAALADLLQRPRIPLAADLPPARAPAVAWIDPERCIGCTLCIDACPVDAILGAARQLHAVVPALCTGCELCFAPCPVDCIEPRPAGRTWTSVDAQAARARHVARERRRAAGVRLEERGREHAAGDAKAARARAIEAALERARARRHPALRGR
jgi:electron transport complex protein RnfB